MRAGSCDRTERLRNCTGKSVSRAYRYRWPPKCTNDGRPRCLHRTRVPGAGCLGRCPPPPPTHSLLTSPATTCTSCTLPLPFFWSSSPEWRNARRDPRTGPHLSDHLAPYVPPQAGAQAPPEVGYSTEILQSIRFSRLLTGAHSSPCPLEMVGMPGRKSVLLPSRARTHTWRLGAWYTTELCPSVHQKPQKPKAAFGAATVALKQAVQSSEQCLHCISNHVVRAT